MARLLTREQAARAIYFDFEGCKGEVPSLLGWSFKRDDGTEHFRQRIVERALWSARHTVPHTGGEQMCRRSTLNAAVARVVALAEDQERLIVSWARHDMNMIEEYVDDPSLVARAKLLYMNALPTARQWLKRVHPDFALPRTWSGKHRLASYCEIMGMAVPEKYGQDVAAKGIRAAREAIDNYRSYPRIPPDSVDARRAWKAVLGHNRLDCKIARQVVTRAAREYAATEPA